jgi:hypothetical protein
LTEKVKSHWEYSREMKMFVKVMDSWMGLRSITEIEKVSLTVTEKMKSINCQRG